MTSDDTSKPAASHHAEENVLPFRDGPIFSASGELDSRFFKRHELAFLKQTFWAALRDEEADRRAFSSIAWRAASGSDGRRPSASTARIRERKLAAYRPDPRRMVGIDKLAIQRNHRYAVYAVPFAALECIARSTVNKSSLRFVGLVK